MWHFTLRMLQICHRRSKSDRRFLAASTKIKKNAEPFPALTMTFEVPIVRFNSTQRRRPSCDGYGH